MHSLTRCLSEESSLQFFPAQPLLPSFSTFSTQLKLPSDSKTAPFTLCQISDPVLIRYVASLSFFSMHSVPQKQSIFFLKVLSSIYQQTNSHSLVLPESYNNHLVQVFLLVSFWLVSLPSCITERSLHNLWCLISGILHPGNNAGFRKNSRKCLTYILLILCVYFYILWR